MRLKFVKEQDVTKRVCFDLEARTAIKRGFDKIAAIAQVTLGPVGGAVAVERVIGDSGPELLKDTATIVRRILEIPGVFENMAGAMMNGVQIVTGQKIQSQAVKDRYTGSFDLHFPSLSLSCFQLLAEVCMMLFSQNQNLHLW